MGDERKKNVWRTKRQIKFDSMETHCRRHVHQTNMHNMHFVAQRRIDSRAHNQTRQRRDASICRLTSAFSGPNCMQCRPFIFAKIWYPPSKNRLLLLLPSCVDVSEIRIFKNYVIQSACVDGRSASPAEVVSSSITPRFVFMVFVWVSKTDGQGKYTYTRTHHRHIGCAKQKFHTCRTDDDGWSHGSSAFRAFCSILFTLFIILGTRIQ